MVFNKKIINQFIIFISLLGGLFFFILPNFGSEGRQTKRKTFDVIIVLGAPASDDCSPSPIMLQRVNKGLELLNIGFAKKLIFWPLVVITLK